MKEIQIRVGVGTLKYIYDDSLLPLTKLGQATTKRASHVEPENNSWVVDLSPINGPKLGPFQLREQALQAERAWIHEYKIPDSKV
jgi:hypothetical protein